MNNAIKASLLIVFALCGKGVSQAQTSTTTAYEQKEGVKIHGILRGKYEYEPDLSAGRFEVRNARLSAEGNLSKRSAYKLEVDLCDESAIKMKDAWVRLLLPLTGGDREGLLRVTLGQQRMPFSIDAHRNPSAQYFANRSFIAKQMGDMRDVGAAVGYDFVDKDNRKVVSVDAGMYNGSNLDNQKTAWFDSPAYSARIQYFPMKGLAIIPSVQHQLIANREASYTSVDFGAYYEIPLPVREGQGGSLHLEAEYLRKFYAKDAFDDCNAVNAMAIWTLPTSLKGRSNSFFSGISALLRYDYMDNHSDGKKGWTSPDLSTGTLPSGEGGGRGRLVQSDAQRHRLTAGLTFHVRNKLFPTDIRLNYEKYWYPNNGTPKESEQDKLVAELMIRF